MWPNFGIGSLHKFQASWCCPCWRLRDQLLLAMQAAPWIPLQSPAQGLGNQCACLLQYNDGDQKVTGAFNVAWEFSKFPKVGNVLPCACSHGDHSTSSQPHYLNKLCLPFIIIIPLFKEGKDKTLDVAVIIIFCRNILLNFCKSFKLFFWRSHFKVTLAPGFGSSKKLKLNFKQIHELVKKIPLTVQISLANLVELL